MATIKKVRVGVTNYDIEDATARSNASNAQNTANSANSTANSALNTAKSANSTANSANSTANSANSTANSALNTAKSKANITNTINAPWLRSVISDTDSSITVVTASIHETNVGITTAYGTGAYWQDVLLNIPSDCQPDNGFYSVLVSANMLNNVGAISCVVMSYSKEQILVRLLNPVSGTFTFDLMIQALGF